MAKGMNWERNKVKQRVNRENYHYSVPDDERKKKAEMKRVAGMLFDSLNITYIEVEPWHWVVAGEWNFWPTKHKWNRVPAPGVAYDRANVGLQELVRRIKHPRL